MGPKRKVVSISDAEVKITRKRLRPKNTNLDGKKNYANQSPQIKKVKRELRSTEEIFLSKLEQNVKLKKTKRNETKKDIVTKDQKPVIAPIDKECPISDTCFVYSDSSGIWDCMLNQTNIQSNNNKFYLIQLLKSCKNDNYFVWMRWGRIGFTGQHTLQEFRSNFEAAKSLFIKKFSDKTKNEWEERDCFEKVQGKYDLIYLDYQPGEDVPDTVKLTNKVDSILEPHVKRLIELICDVKAMEQTVADLLYDSKRAPLGKLTEDQVVAGYAALKAVSDLIDSSLNGSRKQLLLACNIYYTRIPHAFKMRIPPLIDTKSQVEVEMVLLNTLADIQAAMNVIGIIHDSNKNPTDEHYERLKCNMLHLNESDNEYKLVRTYMETTHGKTHSLYTLEVEHIYKIEKLENNFKDVGNRMLLWHGSRQTNWAGILSQGLRIAPPEAPSTGYMFGKGIYFADVASKSANYCNASPLKPEGILILCEVALGKCNKLLQADYKASKLPSDCNSVVGCGKTIPDPKNLVKLNDGLQIPMGPTMTLDGKSSENVCLQYNEFIVYDPLQVKMKYLLQVKFNFTFNK